MSRRGSLILIAIIAALGVTTSSNLTPPSLSQAMDHAPTPASARCSASPIKAHLRAWLDRLPTRPDGSAALPPGVPAPPAQKPAAESHALNIELTLINTSKNLHTARVISLAWSQVQTVHPIPWQVQPDLSPMNRFQFIQRQLVKPMHDEPINVDLQLNLDGQVCLLRAQAKLAN